MLLFSLDTFDATHTLFVLERPDRPTLFLFVQDRSGVTTTFHVDANTEGATVTSLPREETVHLMLTGEHQRVLRWTDEGSEAPVSPTESVEWDVPTDEGTWTVRYVANRRVLITSPTREGSVVAQGNLDNLGGKSVTFDIWSYDHLAEETKAFQILVEAMVLQRLLLSPDRRRRHAL